MYCVLAANVTSSLSVGIIPMGELFSTVQNQYGQISYSYLVPNISFNFKDAMCQTVCTRHGLQEGWVFCALHAV